MPSVSRDLRLFGLDLGALWAALRRPWEAAPGWPIVSWLAPDQPVRVVRADAPDAFWQGARGRNSPSRCVFQMERKGAKGAEGAKDVKGSGDSGFRPGTRLGIAGVQIAARS